MMIRSSSYTSLFPFLCFLFFVPFLQPFSLSSTTGHFFLNLLVSRFPIHLLALSPFALSLPFPRFISPFFSSLPRVRPQTQRCPASRPPRLPSLGVRPGPPDQPRPGAGDHACEGLHTRADSSNSLHLTRKKAAVMTFFFRHFSLFKIYSLPFILLFLR